MFGLLGQQVKEALTTLGLGYNDYSVFSDQEYENRRQPRLEKVIYDGRQNGSVDLR